MEHSRVVHSRVVELSSKLDLEQLEDMQATHQTKMEQMSSIVKQLSGVGASCHSGC